MVLTDLTLACMAFSFYSLFEEASSFGTRAKRCETSSSSLPWPELASCCQIDGDARARTVQTSLHAERNGGGGPRWNWTSCSSSSPPRPAPSIHPFPPTTNVVLNDSIDSRTGLWHCSAADDVKTPNQRDRRRRYVVCASLWIGPLYVSPLPFSQHNNPAYKQKGTQVAQVYLLKQRTDDTDCYDHYY
jgi:hypothetical protein